MVMHLLQELMEWFGQVPRYGEGKTMDVAVLHRYNKTMIANVAHGNH